MVDWHCRAEDIQAYADGELDGAALQECEAHLRRCPTCARLAARLLALSQSLGVIESQRPPAGLRERVLEAVAQAPGAAPLACSEAAELASAYLDDELDASDRDRLEAHLFSCPACYARYRRMQSVVESLWVIPTATAPADLHPRILAAVERVAHGGRFTWRRVAQVAAGMAAAAAVALAVFVPNRHEPLLSTAGPLTVAARPAPEQPAPEGAAEPAESAEAEVVAMQPSEATSPTTGGGGLSVTRPGRCATGESRSTHDTAPPHDATAVRPARPDTVAPAGPVLVNVEEPVMAAARPEAEVRPAAPAAVIAAAGPGPSAVAPPPPAVSAPATAPVRIALAPEPAVEAVARASEATHTAPAASAVPYRASYVRVHEGGSQRDPETDRRIAAAITERARVAAWNTEDTGIELR